MTRDCQCQCDPAVFGHTCEPYGPPWLSAALARLRAIAAADAIRRARLAAGATTRGTA